MMFNLKLENRLEYWLEFRRRLEKSKTPYIDVWEFWKSAPFIPHNQKIDRYNQNSWPTAWEIIADNKYDDFTKSLMMAYTLKLTKKFANSNFIIQTLVDNLNHREYNILIVDQAWVLNLDDNGPILFDKLPDSFILENHIELR